MFVSEDRRHQPLWCAGNRGFLFQSQSHKSSYSNSLQTVMGWSSGQSLGCFLESQTSHLRDILNVYHQYNELYLQRGSLFWNPFNTEVTQILSAVKNLQALGCKIWADFCIKRYMCRKQPNPVVLLSAFFRHLYLYPCSALFGCVEAPLNTRG
jgi:hypothetical protein